MQSYGAFTPNVMDAMHAGLGLVSVNLNGTMTRVGNSTHESTLQSLGCSHSGFGDKVVKSLYARLSQANSRSENFLMSRK